MDTRLNFSQQMQQRMSMSPQMIQSIQIMSLPVEDLRERIFEEVEKNPALEILGDGKFINRGPVDNTRVSTRVGSSVESDDFQAFIENTQGYQESLQDHLLAQIRVIPLTEDELRIGERIIQNLDDKGFNASDPENILDATDSLGTMQKVLQIVRNLDPVGTACNNVEESLLVQAQSYSNCPPLVTEILKNHFPLMGKKRPALIQKALEERGVSCTLKRVEEAMDFIKTLDPYPARWFSKGKNSYVEPEIFIRRASEEETEETGNKFIVDFADDIIPQVGLSNIYTQLLENKRLEGDEKKFLQDSIKEGKWFLSAIEMRKTNIVKIVQYIVAFQELFFDKGPGYLKPLRLKDIADVLEIHEATVSRIVNSKYLQCEWGLFNLKYFFTNAVSTTLIKSSEDNENKVPMVASKESVKHVLQEIIQEHEKDPGGKKLSDEKLSKLLAERGVSVARRTVAKYRSELQIESSFDRT